MAADGGKPFYWVSLGTDLAALERHEEAAAALRQARLILAQALQHPVDGGDAQRP